jgi:aldose sugar dehydrogenase
VPVFQSLERPWSIGFLPGGNILVTERPGRLQLIRPAAPASIVSGTPDVYDREHGGLMDVAVDPSFAENRTVYLSYTQGAEDSTTMRVMRARLDVEAATLSDQQVIFESAPPGAYLEQIGGRLAVSPEGYLFLSLGERQKDPTRAQHLSDHGGSIVRIRTDGTVPEDNPFVGRAGAKPEIWSYGHRNPQGLAIDFTTGELWSHEHGPAGGDELNLIEGGRNYGWPVITYGKEYSGKPVVTGSVKAGMEQPVYYWEPDVAPSSLALKREGETLVLWAGALVGQMLVRLEVADGCVISEQRFLKDALGRIRDVRISPDGTMYLLTDGRSEALYRLEPTPEISSSKPVSAPIPLE